MPRARTLPLAFYRRDAETVARSLLGCHLIRRLDDGRRLVARIVETEAYLGAPDRASHAWNDRRTRRTESLFQDGGTAYVYLVYGMHHMLNVVTGTAADGTAVLLRAAEALEGAGRMARHRRLGNRRGPGALAGGPAKLCQALAVDLELDRAPLTRGALTLTTGRPVEPGEVVRGPRVGVDYAGEAAAWPLRYAIRAHPDVSRPRPEERR